jgi:hypothetical protein
MKFNLRENLLKSNSFAQNSEWFRPWILVLIITMAFCLIALIQNVWNPYSFILIGKSFDPVHGVLEKGYDGQFAYQIALDPVAAAKYLDVPAYRYQRIFYPLLSRIMALGIPSAIPWTLIGINILSIALGTLATEKILHQYGKNRWYSLAFGLFAGMLMSLRLDLTEPLAFALAQWGVLLFTRKRFGLSGVVLALAILTRELMILFAAACVISFFLQGEKVKSSLWGALVVLPFVIWEIILRFWLGKWGIASGGAMATPFEIIPFHGLWGYQTRDLQLFSLLSIFVLMVALIPATVAILAGIREIINRHFGLGVWLMLLNAMIFPFLPTSNVSNLPGLVRITTGLVVAVLDYGAMESSKRALRFSLLWLLLLLFGEGLMAIY